MNVPIVTYPGFSIHDGTLLHSKSQYTTVKHSRQLSERPTRTVSEHSILYNFSNRTFCGGLKTLTPILAVTKLPNTPGQSVVGLSVHLHATTAPRRIVHH
jgi:hypothetical protein